MSFINQHLLKYYKTIKLTRWVQNLKSWNSLLGVKESQQTIQPLRSYVLRYLSISFIWMHIGILTYLRRYSVRTNDVKLKYETTRLFSPLLWTTNCSNYQKIELQQVYLRSSLKDQVLAKLEGHYFISTTGHSHKRQGYDAHQEEAIQRTKSHASGSADFAR